YRAEFVAPFAIGARAAPTEKARVGLRGARVERMREYARRISLPDFDDAVDCGLAPFFEDSPGERNMLAASYRAIGARQIAGSIGKRAGKKWPDRAVRRGRHINPTPACRSCHAERNPACKGSRACRPSPECRI